jgi:hypothetical protein
MHQTGRGRWLASNWHRSPLPGKFSTLAEAPQVMRGYLTPQELRSLTEEVAIDDTTVRREVTS